MNAMRWLGLTWRAIVAATALMMGMMMSAASGAHQKYAHDIKGLDFGFITFGNASEYQIAQGAWFKRFAEAEGARAEFS